MPTGYNVRQDKKKQEKTRKASFILSQQRDKLQKLIQLGKFVILTSFNKEVSISCGLNGFWLTPY